nr:hypothetical protein [Bacteroidota bacterium]
MNNETRFLKYLDQQLTTKEMRAIEGDLMREPGLKILFEEVKKKRELILETMELLNPTENIPVPPFSAKYPKKGHQRAMFMPLGIKIWQYAAGIAILMALALSMWLLNKDKHDNLTAALNPTATVTKFDIEELNNYISPNRCWNQRQLVWTIIENNQN